MGLLFLQGAAAHPDSEEQQQRLREAAEGLRMATNAAAQNAIKKKLVHKLEVRCRARGPQKASRHGQRTRQGWEPPHPCTFQRDKVLFMYSVCAASGRAPPTAPFPSLVHTVSLWDAGHQGCWRSSGVAGRGMRGV